jgi:ligand-binding SRPBCC domain-containing protein
MSCHIQFEQWVPFPLERVFAFFSNPENLPRIMPASTKTQIIRVNLMAPPAPLTGVGEELTTTKAAGVGSIIVTSFHVFPFLPIRAQWTSRITEFEWNHHFADVQDKGPFKNWHHRHQFARESRDGIDGSVVGDVVDYEVGFRFLGTVANRLFIARQMRSAFAQRQRVLPQLLAKQT